MKENNKQIKLIQEQLMKMLKNRERENDIGEKNESDDTQNM